MCARFDDVREAPLPPGAVARRAARVRGRRRPAATSTSPAVGRIREGIAAGDYYQVNLCRVLSAPLPPGADLLGLADAARRRATRRRTPVSSGCRRPASTW